MKYRIHKIRCLGNKGGHITQWLVETQEPGEWRWTAATGAKDTRAECLSYVAQCFASGWWPSTVERAMVPAHGME